MTRPLLPSGKSRSSLDLNRLPMNVRQQLETLYAGMCLDRRENLLLFGNPGSGTSRALCALSGQSMLFTATGFWHGTSDGRPKVLHFFRGYRFALVKARIRSHPGSDGDTGECSDDGSCGTDVNSDDDGDYGRDGGGTAVTATTKALTTFDSSDAVEIG